MDKVQFAFPPHIRKVIGTRDNWHCTNEICERSYQGGYMVEIHHIIPAQEARDMGFSEEEINNPKNGTTLCLPDHLKEHLKLEDENGARLIEERIKTKGIWHR